MNFDCNVENVTWPNSYPSVVIRILKKTTEWRTTDIQSCPIKVPPLFRALAVWVVPV